MSNSADFPGRIELPLPDLDAWTGFFCSAEIPLLADTADTIEALRRNEDAVDAHLIAGQLGGDPLLVLKLLAHAASVRSRQRVTDAETTLAALVLMGISPFFRAFGPQPTAEQRLRDVPSALVMLRGLVARARRAAHIAQGLAAHRNDPDVAVIREVALLHDFACMLLLCHAPRLALQIRGDDGAAAAEAQAAIIERQVLGIELASLQQALATSWHLPELLLHLHDEGHRGSLQVRNVLLANRLARYSASAWEQSPLPQTLEQDLHEVGALLRLATEPALNLLRELDQ
jgi:HD-like signal output (HDOD) protein